MRCLYAGMGTDLISGLFIEQAAHELGLLNTNKPFIQCLEVMISCFIYCLLFIFRHCGCLSLISKQTEATDFDTRCQKLLLSLGDRVDHIHSDIIERINPDHRDMIEGLVWPSKSQIHSDGFESFKVGMSCIQEATDILQKDAFHGGRNKSIKTGTSVFMGDIDDDAEPPSSSDPLALVSAGIPCTDHSALGARSRFLGPTALGATVFSQERRYRQREEHFVFTECAPDWEPLALKGALYPKSTIQSVKAQLHDFNFPVFRERTLSLANNNGLSQFVMSFEEFLQKFKQPPVHKGKDLYVEQQVVVQQELDARSRHRSICCIGPPTFETHTLTAPQQVRLQAYRLNAVRRQGTKRVSANQAHGWIADLEQNEDATGRLSTSLPTILTHGCMWCEAPGISRPAMKFEYLSFQSMPCLPDHYWGAGDNLHSVRPPLKFLQVLSTMSDADLQHVAGNACPVKFSTLAILYILSCSTPQAFFFKNYIFCLCFCYFTF